MTDGWMKTRTKGQHNEAEPGAAQVMPPPRIEAPSSGTDVQQAMQMLTLAQRTADEHVATAHRQAETIQTEARSAADQIVREAQAQAEAVRQQADTALSEARAQVEQASRDVQAQAATARQDAEKVVADARTQAAEIDEQARVNADGLDRRAKQRYDEEVGNLAAKREALQQQIESLQGFDRDYRSRLLTFMQAQLRALWVDEPQVDGALPDAPPAQAGAGAPAQAGSGAPAQAGSGASAQAAAKNGAPG